jgi:hypothetical protein
VPDLVVGAWGIYGSTWMGRVYAYAGATGALLWKVDGSSPSAGVGYSLSPLGDVNGDGRPDIVAGAGYDEAHARYGGSVSVLSGADGAELSRAYGQFEWRLGWAVAGLGDLDRNGRLEFLVGAVDSNLNQTGRFRLYEADWPMPPSVYCTAKVNSQGCLPAISFSGAPTASGSDDFVLRADKVINQKPGMALWSLEPYSTAAFGGTLCLSGFVRRTALVNSGGSVGPADCSGTLALPFTQAYMFQNGLLPGTAVHAQFWYRDPAEGPHRVGLTDALAFLVSP